MKVLGSRVHGDYKCLEFQETEPPTLLQDDVLIRVEYTDVNPVDLQKLAGRAGQTGQPVASPPHVPGYGGSGVVVDVGPGCRRSFAKGQAVCFLADPSRPHGSYATHIAVNEKCVAEVNWYCPGGEVDFQSAACIPVAGLTALESLEKCNLANKKNLLVVGGAGGVGVDLGDNHLTRCLAGGADQGERSDCARFAEHGSLLSG